MNSFHEVQHLARSVDAWGGRLVIVGGAVRDMIIGRPTHDIDVEIYGLPEADVEAIIAKFGEAKRVGRSFPVWKLRLTEFGGMEIDVALPRMERKVGPGHRGFVVEFLPGLDFATASGRRDLTMNAMGFDPLSGDLLDPWDGQGDLASGLLHAPTEAFMEDPLRVLRAFRFAGQFDMRLSAQTVTLANAVHREYSTLAQDRIRDEWMKWAQTSIKPSAGLKVLQATGWLTHYPELAALVGVPQDLIHHPEGDAWVHTMYATDAAAAIAIRKGMGPDDRGRFVLAVLCHDLGKVKHTQVRADGRITSYGHDKAGEAPTRSFLARIGALSGLIEEIVPLVREHMAHIGMATPSAKAVRNLANRLAPATIDQLMDVVEADMGGRPPLPPGLPPRCAEILAMAQDEGVMRGKPARIVGGKMLEQLGHAPGPAFSQMIRQAYEAQLDGEFKDEAGAIEWLQAHFPKE